MIASSQDVTRLDFLTPPGTAPTLARVHLDVVALDEWQGTVTVRVSAVPVCQPACPAGFRLVLVAAQPGVLGAVGLPASAALTFPAAADEVTESVTLSIHGAPMRYPFDSYGLRLGILPERVAADGTTRVLSPAEEQGSLAVSLHAHIPGTVLATPTRLDPRQVPIPGRADRDAVVADLRFARPLYTQVLTVLLVRRVTGYPCPAGGRVVSRACPARQRPARHESGRASGRLTTRGWRRHYCFHVLAPVVAERGRNAAIWRSRARKEPSAS